MDDQPPTKHLPFRHSIAATLAGAQSVLVIVLIAISVLTSSQFAEVARLVSVTSDGAEALMRLTFALDLQAETLQAFQAGYVNKPDPAARSKLGALLESVASHVDRASNLVATQAEQNLLRTAAPELKQLRTRLAGFDALDADGREVAQIELEEGLGDVFSQLAKTKLLASAALEARLATVKIEVRRPVQLFWGAAAIGGLIAIAVSLLLRKRVSRPIRALSSAVADLAQGRAARIDSHGRDEIALLGAAFNEMAATITERTRSLKLVFDSVGEGLLTCDRSGKLVAEPSARALDWFGRPAPDSSVASYLGAGNPTWIASFRVSFDQLVEGILPFELCADQMPREVVRDGRIYELTFRQVLEEGEFRRVLVVACDVTEQRALARKEREARDVYALSSFALRDPGGYGDFKKEVVERLHRARQDDHVLLELHTVKGSAGVIGCDSFAEAVHDCESRMLEDKQDTRPVRDLADRFRALCETAEKVVGSGDNDFVVVRRHEYHQLLSLLQVRESNFLERARLLARSWSMHRIGSSFERLAKTGVRSAERQGKAVCVQVSGDQICVSKGELDELWSSLTHLVRNAVAHGIEPTSERLAKGKPAEGRIELHAEIEHSSLVLSVTDDGRGIDWQALTSKVASGEVPANDNVALLFREGVSTAQAVTDLSGRGVGMSAVHRTVVQLGGNIDVQSQPGAGTTIRISVPVGTDIYVPSSSVSLLPNYHSKTPPARPSARAAR